jgi:hypothetical protein
LGKASPAGNWAGRHTQYMKTQDQHIYTQQHTLSFVVVLSVCVCLAVFVSVYRPKRGSSGLSNSPREWHVRILAGRIKRK